MADLDDLPALARKIEPLPGGLGELRQRLRDSRRSRAPLALAVAVASAAVAMCVLQSAPPSPEPDRTAMQRLLVDAEQLPNPRAAQLGLVPRARPVVASDPRVATSDAVVFYWVPPAR
jgi:uncharacterized protein involved in exopolysaccharide biosynthesis